MSVKVLKGQFFLFTNTGEQKPWTAPTALNKKQDGLKEIGL